MVVSVHAMNLDKNNSVRVVKLDRKILTAETEAVFPANTHI